METAAPSVPSALSSSFKLVGHTRAVYVLAGHPFLPILVSGSLDKTVRLWDLETRRCVRTLEDHTDLVEAVAFDPTGRRLASGSHDDTVKLWDLDSAKSCPVHTLRDRAMGKVQAVAWNSLGTLVASASTERHVCVWDVATGSLRHTLMGHLDWVEAVVGHPADDLLASGSDDATVHVSRWSTGESVHILEGHTGGVFSLAASAFFVVSGSYDKTVRVWSWTTGLCVRMLNGFGEAIDSSSLAWRGSTLIVLEPRGTTHMWDTSSDEDPSKWSYVKSVPSSLRMTPHNNDMVIIAYSGAIACVPTNENMRIDVWAVDLADDD